jgi:SAM-dependent methyltransferase
MSMFADALSARVEQLGARISRMVPPPPALRAVSAQQAPIVDALLRSHADDIRRAGLAYPERTGPLERLGDELLAELRLRSGTGPEPGPLLRWASRLHLPSSAGEIMDDPAFPEDSRLALVRTLDRRTQRGGGYVHFAGALAPMLAPERGRRLTIVDLASGHGGFPLALARLLADRNDVRIVATDLRREYLELGEAQAQELGLSGLVEFRVVDALGLAGAEGLDDADVITCTQSLHHFSPGEAVVMLAGAVRRARRGILFVDLVRAASRLLMIGCDAATSLSWPYFHDAVVSVCKAYLPEELRLLCGCVPGGQGLEVSYLHPAFVAVRTASSVQPLRWVG